MNRTVRNFFSKRRLSRGGEIDPDHVLFDSSSSAQFDKMQMEGRLEKPISRLSLYSVFGIFSIMILVFLVQAWNLQIVKGEEYKLRSENNVLRPVPVFAGRGVIYDRNDTLLAWNSPGAIEDENGDNKDDVAKREYATSTGLSHLMGYVQYPSKDNNGFYYQEDFEGVDGVEAYYDDMLQGTNGSRLIEVDARGKIVSENIIRPPAQGEALHLSIDLRVQSALYKNIKDIAESVGFTGGAGIIMDVHTGELLAMTSYPEYSSQVMSDKKDKELVRSMLNNPRLLFLDRSVDGLYTPGSIIKPFVALGVLNEGITDASTVFLTTGSISIPNPYDSTKSTVFKDWKNHGAMDLRHAIEMSSDAYFYIVGGGYKDQKGLGIQKIDEYLNKFGFGQKIGDSFASGKAGTIPTPVWKKETFNEDWYLGNTYHTAIGQYGFQVTPIQAVRAIAAVANYGKLLVPTVKEGDTTRVDAMITDIPTKWFDIVHEGMRMSALTGTSKALNVSYVEIAGKSGTAELGTAKDRVNSWITGYWPYENPKYAFTVMLENGSVHNLIGAAAAMRQTLDWMNINTPEYFKKE